jgi:cytochrome c5
MKVSRAGTIKLTVVLLACTTLAVFAITQRREPAIVEGSVITSDAIAAAPDTDKAKAAFAEAAKVFFSPRCANCHPGGDNPTQYDEMTPHSMAVTRGEDGHGVYGQKCSACHQLQNLPGEHMPPGTSKEWHMPPADQPMVFQGLTAGQLCRNFKDPKTNGGHKTLREAMDHIKKRDPLVTWAWDPGNGRTVPPMGMEEFIAKVDEWVNSGGACPE